MDTFASIALCSEPPRPDVMRYPPKRREENILTPGMLRTISLTAAFFVVVMLTLLIGMKGTPDNPGWFVAANDNWSVEAEGTRKAAPKSELTHDDRGNWFWVHEGNRQPVEVAYTVLQVSIFFSIYVFFQVWNQINSRSLTADMSGFERPVPESDVFGHCQHGGHRPGVDRDVRRRCVQGGTVGCGTLVIDRRVYRFGAGVRGDCAACPRGAAEDVRRGLIVSRVWSAKR